MESLKSSYRVNTYARSAPKMLSWRYTPDKCIIGLQWDNRNSIVNVPFLLRKRGKTVRGNPTRSILGKARSQNISRKIPGRVQNFWSVLQNYRRVKSSSTNPRNSRGTRPFGRNDSAHGLHAVGLPQRHHRQDHDQVAQDYIFLKNHEESPEVAQRFENGNETWDRYSLLLHCIHLGIWSHFPGYLWSHLFNPHEKIH